MRKRVFLIIVSIICCCFISLIAKQKAYAASAAIEFTASENQVRAGGKITVICTVKSDSAFSDTDFYITYDPKLLKFVTGGSKVSGSKGMLHASSVGNETETNKRVFSLSFIARKRGTTSVGISNQARIVTANRTALSVSSNRVTINIMNTDTDSGIEMPLVTASPVVAPSDIPTEAPKSTNANLKVLKSSGINDLKPEFDPKITQYETSVDKDTDHLYFSFQTANKKANVRLEGNEGLTEGLNQISIIVTAESGRRKEYQIAVRKESEQETEDRLWRESDGTDGFGFHVLQKKGKTVIQNNYNFTVLEVSDETLIPAGYIPTKVQLDGVEIPAYTMESDMDNNYLLLYLKGPNEEKAVYQYDRSEKTLQRYTGDMIQRVNKRVGKTKESKADDTKVRQTVLLIVIIVMVVIILCMLMYILKLIGKNRSLKKDSQYDDLDF